MSEENKAVLRRWFDEVWNKKNSAVIREIMTEETLQHGLTGPGGPPVKGFDEFEAFHSAFIKAFPDLRIELGDVVADEDRVAARFTVMGTQEGELQGVPATGKKVQFTGGGICRIKDGKFEEVWNEVDFPKMQYDLAPDTPDIQ